MSAPTSTQLAVKDGGTLVGLIHPTTGEVADVDEPEQVAAWLYAVRDLEAELRSAKLVAAAILNDALDANATASLDLGPFQVRGETWSAAAEAVTYDVEKLSGALAQLRRDRLITRQAAEAALKREVTRKVVAAGVKKLRASSLTVRDAIDACVYETGRDRKNPSVTLRQEAAR